MKQKNTIIIGITAGIAGYKIVDLIKLLREKNYNVVVIMTKHATNMFPKTMFEQISGNKVQSILIPKEFDYKAVLEKKEVEHIKIADSASLLVIAPATANIIGKIVHGIADDFLTTTILAATCPVLICPSMNVHMWQSVIVQDNIDRLKRLGYYILPPDRGRLACGYEGMGRLADLSCITCEITNLLGKQKQLLGKKIIVTAGGTTEPIDAVRTITNRSSGKMGIALADECFLRGAQVLLLRAKTTITPRFNIKSEVFETADDLEKLIAKYVNNYEVIFHTAAVSDFLVEKKIDEKLESKKNITLKLKPAPKIISRIKKWNQKIKLIGFKAVYKLPEKELIEAGIEKLKESNADYTIVNDVGKNGVGFGVDTNEVYIISQKGLLAKIDKAPKKEIARKILEYIF